MIALNYRLLKFFFIAAIFLFVLKSCSNKEKPNEDILATVGQFEISTQHYLNELRRFSERAGHGLNLGSDVMEAVLDTRVNRYAVVEYAMDKGWDSDEDGQYTKMLVERRVLMEEFERRFIHDNVQLTEADLREVFYRANTSVRASHLYAPYRHQADSLFALIQDGKRFEDIASDLFQNRDLANSGGDLGYFTLDDMDIAFEEAAFSMDVGDISAPVKTSRGYSIIKVTDIVNTPVVTETQFANRRSEISMIAREQQYELATRRHMQSVIDSFDFDREAIRLIWDAIQSNPDTFFGFNPEIGVTGLSVEGLNGTDIVASYDGTEITLNKLLQEFQLTPAEQRRRANDFWAFQNQVHGIAYRSFALERVHDHPAFNEEYVRRSTEETFYNYLHQRFDEYIASMVEVDRDAMIREFEQNTEHYQDPLQLNMAEIIVTTEQRAEEAWDALQKGEDFVSVLGRFSIDPSARETNGELGFIPIDQFGMIGPSISNIQPGEYAGPFQVMSNRFIILKCLDRRESRPLSFEEAEDMVKAYLQQKEIDELKIEKIKEAREKFNATLFTDRLHALPQQQ